MCGIVGYVGEKRAVPYLLDSLERVQYRGYDSSGIAYFEKGGIKVEKCPCGARELKMRLDGKNIESKIGIGHTRWATHGEVTERNAHPHVSYKGRFALVHNGIIENYAYLREELKNEGYPFLSDTDSEVVVNLLERDYSFDMINTLSNLQKQLQGSYALAIIDRENPDSIFLMKKESPLVVGKGEGEYFISSDIASLPKEAKEVLTMNEGEIAEIKRGEAKFYLQSGNEVFRRFNEFSLPDLESERGEYESFMKKEIFEQPKAVEDTLFYIWREKETMEKLKKVIKNVDRIYITACGSAYYAALAGKYVFEKLLKIPTETEIASEFRYRDSLINNRSLLFAISQSGETADTVAAVKKAKEKGAYTLSLVNVPYSSCERESDITLYTKAKQERAVATTKAFSCQLASIYAVALRLGKFLGTVEEKDFEFYKNELFALPEKIGDILKDEKHFEKIGKEAAKAERVFFIGRNTDYPCALEGALKLKEISYIPAEAFPGGELKHGTISLITKGSLVFSVMGNEKVFKKTFSNAEEVLSRRGEIIALTTKKKEEDLGIRKDSIIIPDTSDLFLTLCEVIPLQLVAYYAAKEKGRNIDMPRNLAKSVTVE